MRHDPLIERSLFPTLSGSSQSALLAASMFFKNTQFLFCFLRALLQRERLVIEGDERPMQRSKRHVVALDLNPHRLLEAHERRDLLAALRGLIFIDDRLPLGFFSGERVAALVELRVERLTSSRVIAQTETRLLVVSASARHQPPQRRVHRRLHMRALLHRINKTIV